MEMFGTVDRDTRARAKTINFAILYGISRWGLAARLEVPAEEAQAMIDTYFQRFPGINRYIAETLESARECGFTETLFGRRRPIPDLQSSNFSVRAAAERQAMNAGIQGLAAEMEGAADPGTCVVWVDVIERYVARLLEPLQREPRLVPVWNAVKADLARGLLQAVEQWRQIGL